MKNKPLVISTGLAAVTAVALGAIIYSRMPGPETKPTEVAVSQPPAPEAQPDATAEKPPETAPAEPAQPEVKAEQPAAQPEPAPETTAPEQPKPTAPVEAKPTFDTVRVEAEGSTLAAGHAEPGAEVTLKRNGEEVGKTVANAEGDWVVVTEAPLPKGPSELSLEQKPAAGPVIVSDQSIAVVVPEKPGERAMVALVEPGMPTQVLQKAESTSEAAGPAETAPAKPAETAAAEPPATAPEQAAETEAKPADTAVKPSEPAVAEPATQEPSATTAEATQPTPTEKPAETQTALADPTSQPEQASPTPEPAPAPAPEVKPGMPVSLDAVDYNSAGDIVFSGRASPGSAVRVYVDNKPVGDSLADAAGKWTFAGTEKVAPGGHSLRVDQIDQGGKVLSRVELPFVREDAARVAEIVAAEQPAQPEPTKAAEPAETAAAEPEIRTTITETPAPDTTTTEQSEPAVAMADPAAETKTEQTPPAAATTEPAKTEVTSPSTSEVAKADSATTTTEAAKKEEPQPATTEVAKTEEPAAAQEPVTQPEQPTAEEPTTTTTKADPATSETAVATGEAASTAAAKPEAQPESADEPDTSAEPVHSETQESAAAGTADTTLPPQPKNGRVVIQPGNNLWKLSRVIYGKGISYTVLYEANKEQIRDPDLIYPGQIFATPNAVPPETIDPKRKKPLTADEGGAAAE
jgi:nucleoid-associated protein YgaU